MRAPRRRCTRSARSATSFIVGGLSTGALLALLLAARNPKLVQGTMSYAPTIWLNGWVIPWYARFFNLVHLKWFANLISFPDHEPHGIKDPRVRDFVRKAFMNKESAVAGLPSTPGGAVLEHRWLSRTVRREIGKTSQPALLIHPREDDYAHLNNAEFLQKKLSGRVNTVILDDSYHNITIDKQRQIVVERTVSFATQVAKELETAKAAVKADAPRARRSGAGTPQIGPPVAISARPFSRSRRGSHPRPRRGPGRWGGTPRSTPRTASGSRGRRPCRNEG